MGFKTKESVIECQDKTLTCPKCNRKYGRTSDLTRHLRSNICFKAFPSPSELQSSGKPSKSQNDKDKKQDHRNEDKAMVPSLAGCAGCGMMFCTSKQLDFHIVAAHGEDHEVDQMTFKTQEEFQQWRDYMERNTKTNFNNRIKYGFRTFHRCNALKNNDGVLACPATIITKIIGDQISVAFYKVHYEHSHEKYRVPMQFVKNIVSQTKSPNQKLYEKFKAILESVLAHAATLGGDDLTKLLGLAESMADTLKHISLKNMNKATEKVTVVKKYVTKPNNDIAVVKKPDVNENQNVIALPKDPLSLEDEEPHFDGEVPLHVNKEIFIIKDKVKRNPLPVATSTPVPNLNVKSRSKTGKNNNKEVLPKIVETYSINDDKKKKGSDKNTFEDSFQSFLSQFTPKEVVDDDTSLDSLTKKEPISFYKKNNKTASVKRTFPITPGMDINADSKKPKIDSFDLSKPVTRSRRKTLNTNADLEIDKITAHQIPINNGISRNSLNIQKTKPKHIANIEKDLEPMNSNKTTIAKTNLPVKVSENSTKVKTNLPMKIIKDDSNINKGKKRNASTQNRTKGNESEYMEFVPNSATKLTQSIIKTSAGEKSFTILPMDVSNNKSNDIDSDEENSKAHLKSIDAKNIGKNTSKGKPVPAILSKPQLIVQRLPIDVSKSINVNDINNDKKSYNTRKSSKIDVNPKTALKNASNALKNAQDKQNVTSNIEKIAQKASKISKTVKNDIQSEMKVTISKKASKKVEVPYLEEDELEKEMQRMFREDIEDEVETEEIEYLDEDELEIDAAESDEEDESLEEDIYDEEEEEEEIDETHEGEEVDDMKLEVEEDNKFETEKEMKRKQEKFIVKKRRNDCNVLIIT